MRQENLCRNLTIFLWNFDYALLQISLPSSDRKSADVCISKGSSLACPGWVESSIYGGWFSEPIFSNLCRVTHSSFCFSLQFCFSSVLLLFLYICLVYIRDDVDEHRSEQRNNEQMSMLDSTTKSPLYLWMWFKSMLFLFCEIGSMQGAGWTSRF